MMTLEEAKKQVGDLLELAQGDHEAVFRALVSAQRLGREGANYTAEHDEDYGMQRLALADLAGISAYRG